MPDFEAIPYRIRIGVTGHRALENPERVSELVKQAVKQTTWNLFTREASEVVERVKEYGATPISYTVLSPLAEGADRIVARAILEEPHAKLKAVLPLAIEDYLEDFASEESKQEFRELLSKSNRPVLLREKLIREERRDPEDQAELRHDAYLAVGRYVVDHCDVLIAVWDGEPARGRGGTAEIVAYAIEQELPIIRIWQGEPEVYSCNSQSMLAVHALEGIDRFNRQRIGAHQRAAEATDLQARLFDARPAGIEIPAETQTMVRATLFPHYAQASIASMRNQTKYYRAGRYTYTLSAAAVGCAAAGVLFPALAALGFGAELLLMIAILATLYREKKAHAHRTWIEYRFLAERLRAGIFMAICGVEPQPVYVPTYMGHSQTVNDWTVRAFDELWDRLPPFGGRCKDDWKKLNAYICQAWIADQVTYHDGKQKKEGKMRRRLALIGKIVLPATVAAAALHLALLAWEPGGGQSEGLRILHHVLHQGLAFIALLFPAVAASLAGMEAHREHLRLEKRSENMKEQLERLRNKMATARNPVEFETALQDLDEEVMLRETQDWLMLMRYVEIKAG